MYRFSSIRTANEMNANPELEKWQTNQNIRNVSILALFFMISYTPWQCVYNLMPLFDYQEEKFSDLICMIVLTLSRCFVAVFAAAILSRVGFKWSFVIGVIMNALFLFTQVLPFYRDIVNDSGDKFPLNNAAITTLLVLGSVLSGAGHVIQWVGQLEYVSQCSTYEQKGKIFAQFRGIMSIQIILGNLLGIIFVEESALNVKMAFVLAAIMLCSSGMYFLVMQPQVFEPFMITVAIKN